MPSLFLPDDSSNTPSANQPTTDQTAQSAQPGQQPQQSIAPPTQPQPVPAPTAAPQPQQPTQTQQPQHINAAQRIRDVAEVFAGGPRYKTEIDATTGATTRKPVPLSKSDIGLAIALTALSGGLAGMSATGPNAAGKGGALGLQQGEKIAATRLAARQREDEQARADYERQTAAMIRRAQIAEVNSRTLLNTSEAEKHGADAIDKLVDINRASGVLDVDPDNLDNGGKPMTQAELYDAMQSGKLNSTDQVGPIAGRVEITNPDGTKRWEATHLVVRDPNSPVRLTQEMWDRFAAGNVPGFPAGAKIGGGTEVKLATVQRANEVLAAHTLADFRLKDLRDVLSGTQWADKVPASIDFSKPGVETAVQRFQKYVSHSAQHGMDVYESLQQMGADKRDPKTGEMQPNADAKYVDTVAAALGGWPVLKAVHDKLASDSAAEKSRAEARARGDEEIETARRMSPIKTAQAVATAQAEMPTRIATAAAEGRARAKAEGQDVRTMIETGINPLTGERLSLQNAPDEQLVDTKTGLPIPTKLLSTMKPTTTEIQRADFAQSAIHSADAVMELVRRGKAKVGPFSGPVNALMAKAGLGDKFNQELQNYVRFAQSAATAAHTGRFSVPILDKMAQQIDPRMNFDQLEGSVDSIKATMRPYADAGWRPSVAEYKSAIGNQPGSAPTAQAGQRVIPAGATPGRDANGNIIGYRTADGKVVRF